MSRAQRVQLAKIAAGYVAKQTLILKTENAQKIRGRGIAASNIWLKQESNLRLGLHNKSCHSYGQNLDNSRINVDKCLNLY